MGWALAIAVVFLVVIGTALFVLLDRRSTAQRDDVDIDSLLANLGRLEALDATGLMDAPVRPELDALTREAATTLGAPMSFISLVDDHRQFFASAYGRDLSLPRETDLNHSYCKHVVAGQAPFQVTNAIRDERVKNNLGTIVGGVRSYLGVPVRSESGHVIGSFCVVDTAAREWDDEAQTQLEQMASRAMAVALHKPAS